MDVGKLWPWPSSELLGLSPRYSQFVRLSHLSLSPDVAQSGPTSSSLTEM